VLARPWRNRWSAGALAAGVLLASGAAAGYAVTRPPNHDFGTVPAGSARGGGPASTVASAGRGDPAGASGTGGGPAAGPGRPAGAASPSGLPQMTTVAVPVRLQIPVLGVSAAIVSVGVAANGGLGIPADPSVVGWWAGGGSPGQPSGATVLTGHIDSAVSGPGALFRLQDVRPGAMVIVTAAGRTYRYVVQATRAYLKTQLPAATIFDQQVTPRLIIVSCGGPFDADTGHYLDNIVAYALPARPDTSP
jgi:hypothetical protein